MKRPFFLISALLLLLAAQSSFALGARPVPPLPQQEQEAAPLTNADVMEMVKTGLSADIIVAKIKASVSKFDTSPSALQQLKADGVPEAVILAMVQAPVGVKPGVAGGEDEAAVPGSTQAFVYVYRKKNFGTRNMQPSVYTDGAEVARMDDGRYFIIKLDPGKHTIEVNKGHSGAEVDMKAGRKYYFRVEMVPGFWKARGKIDFMQREQGELEIQKMKPLDAKWIKDKSKVSVGELTSNPQ